MTNEGTPASMSNKDGAFGYSDKEKDQLKKKYDELPPELQSPTVNNPVAELHKELQRESRPEKAQLRKVVLESSGASKLAEIDERIHRLKSEDKSADIAQLKELLKSLEITGADQQTSDEAEAQRKTIEVIISSYQTAEVARIDYINYLGSCLDNTRNSVFFN